jgi:uncharacterized protein
VTVLTLKGAKLTLDPSGALWWPEEATLVVADLHLDKEPDSSPRGRLLPPHETRATIDRLAVVIRRYRPRRVVVLGDGVPDAAAAQRMEKGDVEQLLDLIKAHEWIWLAEDLGPAPASAFGGRIGRELASPPLLLRHEPGEDYRSGEVSGHFHPMAAVRVRGRRISGRCFVSDGERLVIPAFGAHRGGLDALDPAIAGIFRAQLRVYLIGREAIYLFPGERLERMQPLPEALAAVR